jgi:hypothetical protein
MKSLNTTRFAKQGNFISMVTAGDALPKDQDSYKKFLKEINAV